MSRSRTVWSIGIVLGAAALLLGHRPLIEAFMVQDAKVVAIGAKVPEFSVTDVAGKAWTLADLRKRSDSGVVSLTFWCTFCHSCRMMDARFQKQAADFKDKAAVVAVDASAADTAKKVEDFTRDRKFGVPVFLDADGKAADLFGVRLTTTTVVLDKAGVLRYRGSFGSEDQPHARNALRAVLDGKEVAVKETAPSG
jgi:peroxiredoxin